MDQAPVTVTGVVYLRSGSPPLTTLGDFGAYVTVGWFTSDGAMHTADVPPEALTTERPEF